jgi:hypothetical protein
VPDEPLEPDVPDVPDVPPVPLEPDVPEDPDVPLVPPDPLVCFNTKLASVIPPKNQYSTTGSVATNKPTVKPSYLYDANKYVVAAVLAAARFAPEYGPYLASAGPVVLASILSLKLIAI